MCSFVILLISFAVPFYSKIKWPISESDTIIIYVSEELFSKIYDILFEYLCIKQYHTKYNNILFTTCIDWLSRFNQFYDY